MSNMFYDYLTARITDFFRENPPKPGEKFYIQLETEEQVKTLYDKLRENIISVPFLYRDEKREQVYKSYQLSFGPVKLIIAAAMENGPHPDFLATLRNLVGVEENYRDKGILFLHCSSLDSILGGAGSLCKEGMPLSIETIERDIRNKIKDNEFSDVDKEILNFYLENKRKELDGIPASIFEYEDLIDTLGDSHITEEDYSRFELFPDDQLECAGGKKRKARLEANHGNFVRISEIHSYGADETALEKYYGEEGAKRLKREDWRKVTYPEIEKFIADRKYKAVIEYFPIISDKNIWDREEGLTKAKMRIRNIIVFTQTSDDNISLTLNFSDFTKSADISITRAYEKSLSCVNAGKKLRVTLNNVSEPSSFYRFRYNAKGGKFEFKIAVLRCSPSLLEGIKTQYIVDAGTKPMDSSILVNSEEEEIIFNPCGTKKRKVTVTDKEQVIHMEKDEQISVTVSEDYSGTEEDDTARFAISTEGFHVFITRAFSVEGTTVIGGLKLWYLKRTRKTNFEILGENRLVFGTKPYFTRDEFRKSLDLEKRYIEFEAPFAVEYQNESLESAQISLPQSVQTAFNNIVSYYKRHNEIPSLTFLNQELKTLYSAYLAAIKAEVNGIQEGDYLTDEQKGIFCLGMIKRNYGDKEILLTPLHPINVAYQMFIDEVEIKGLEEDEIELLRKFQQTALLPYINIDPETGEKKVYIPAEQTHSPEWKIYVEETLPRYKGSKDFVSKLVAEKIREFAEHFSYLFVPEAEAPIRINLINTGDCREIVQGIVKYYVKALNDSRKIIPVKVTMYAGSKIESAFETMSKIDDTDTLVKALGLEIRAEDKSADEIIDLYRQKVQFYSKKADDELEYAHITFMELDDDDQAISTNMEDIPSGVVMNGISSGVPSAMLGDSYRTGFGTGYIRTDSELLDIAVKMNALNAAMNGDSYRKGSCYALKMSPNKQHLLNKVYDASNWVTFINPRVDLNYFKSDPGAKDLLIIHYSDQYNMTSSGYDAITVTRKSEQYQNTISRYLKKNGVEDENAHSKQIINIFNALNGDWLLRMLSYNSHFPVEKLSILSAMKLAVKSYTRDNIIWVPISLEEILRVSGSVGLSKNESVFSAKNLGFEEGSTSDDLLLVGIKNTEPVQVMFYPIEVKIGSVEGGYLEKGVWQALKTRGIFEEILEMGPCRGKSIKVRLYRNFFMQQVVVNAGKMLLYDVGDGHQGWENVTETDLRRKLLNEEYEIVEMLFPEMGMAGIISFRDGYTGEKEQRYQDVLIIEKSKKEGVNLLAKSFDEIKPIKWSEVPQVSSLPEEAETETDTGAETVETEELPTETGYGDQRISPGQEPDTGSVQEERKMEEIRALIGKDRFLNEIYWEFGNKALANRHLLITGTSGQGKTYSIQTILYELAKYNISSVIFDYTEGFMLQQLEKAFKDALGSRISQKIVYSTGVPVNPFKRHEVDLAGQKILEKESDVAARLADIFVHVYDFGDQQYSAIFDAAYNGLKKYGEKMNMDIFRNELEAVALQNKSAKTVLSKMSPFFHTVEFEKDPAFDWSEVLYADEAKINIVQLTLFTREMQVIITEMMLWDAWYYTKKYGSKDKPFVVVLDEAQNLSHTTKSPSASILTEGRKFGWSAWFATQSLKILKDDEVVRLLQAAFKLYFKPTDEEMAKIAKQLDVTGDTNWLAALKSLKKGQCIAAGDRMKSNGKVGPSAPVITDITSFEERL